MLSEAQGTTLLVSAVESLQLTENTPTFNLTVACVSTFFVRLGGSCVLVHNSGAGPNYNQVLYWYFGKKPNLRPTDLDGLSVWKTTSKEQVDALLSHRVNVAGRSLSDPHGFLTEEELAKAGLTAPKTPSGDPLADTLPHHSLRPADAPPFRTQLTEEELKALTAEQRSALEKYLSEGAKLSEEEMEALAQAMTKVNGLNPEQMASLGKNVEALPKTVVKPGKVPC
jgi:hypothetical protein